MNINNIKIGKSIAKMMLLTLPVASIGGGLLTSCSDFLDILPLNDVVLENYWTKKDDVTSVLNSCYESLASEESMNRIGMWGEIRSENLIEGGTISNYINEILKENILPTNETTNWAVIYTTINRCNTVIHYAPGVNEKDPNYTYDQMRANVAEASFLRDLCYFYLIRAFRDVPMSFEPSIDDTKNYAIPATPMAEGLKLLAEDLEKVKGDAVRRYYDDSRLNNSSAASTAYENCCKVTRVAVYALLADIYLWMGEYDKSIQCCDYVINFKKEQYKEKVTNLGEADFADMHEFAGIPMILEKKDGSLKYGNAYSEIFGTGFSFESLFELGYRNSYGQSNKYVSNFFGSPSNALGRFSTPEEHIMNIETGNNSLFSKNDSRAYATINKNRNDYVIGKYTNSEVEIDFTQLASGTVKWSINRRSDEYANWIFYRLSDVMLIKAEALIQKGDTEFEKAFALINAVNKRARNIVTTSDKDTLTYSTYSGSKEDMENLLFQERKREFMFEGKRWFDLVRRSMRDGNTKYLANQAVAKQKENAVAIKIQLADINAIFLPYNRDELKKNNLLKQNSAYSDAEDFQK